ncbi:MAG TPA: C1 family peptidase [Roseovarius sp.]
MSENLLTGSGVRRDWVDLRDQAYVPNLSILPDTLFLDAKTAPFVRNQGSSGRCVGFALANVIDIQRNLQKHSRSAASVNTDDSDDGHQRNVVSADMLYRMAHFHDQYPSAGEAVSTADEGVRTLRSAIKGFYHHGACLDWPEASLPRDTARWQSTCYNTEAPDKTRRFPSVEQAKKAREIGLGSYFRIASVLNHFHAALSETKAVLVTANIHDGWFRAVPENGGKIVWPPPMGKTGTHAFALTGYDEFGFHVLNSWGAEWGGYGEQPGIALWSYEDWAQNVIDGWVLQLGVRAPSAFGVSIGERGTKGRTSSVRAGSTPAFELVGHYMHLDDGFHVSTGSYPSFRSGWRRTSDYLLEKLDPKAEPSETEQTAYRGVLIWIPGSLEGIKSAFAAAVHRKAPIKALGLYPYSIFWCNSFVEKSLEVLEIIFETCKKQAGEDAAHLDSLIEQRVQGVGRAFWRDIEMGARRAVKGTGELPHEPDETDAPKRRIERGYVAEFLADIMKLKAKTGCEIHLVAEGAGALVVHEMLSIIDQDSRRQDHAKCLFCGHNPRDLFDTLHLVHPAIGVPRAKKQLLKLIDAMNGKISGDRMRASSARRPNVQPLLKSKSQPTARIYIPTPALEEAVQFGSYGKSILHLVSQAFEDRYPAPKNDDGEDLAHLREPRPFLGMSRIADDKDFPASGAIHRLNRIESQVHATDRISQTELNNDQTVTNSIFEMIKAMRKES